MINQAKINAVCGRVTELEAANRSGQSERKKIRDIMNGGTTAVQALLGNPAVSQGGLPVANLMLAANDRLAQKLGRRPDIKKDPPISSDSETARKRAEKLARIVECYDDVSKVDLMLPQLGRWLPGYGFAALVVRQGWGRNGDPFPVVELRDPYETFPGEWSVGQQPADVAFQRTIPLTKLVQMFPEHRARLDPQRVTGGAVLLGDGGTALRGGEGWANQSGRGVKVYEYLNSEGTWWVAPEHNLLLSFTPNVLSRPCFYIAKRYSFDQLTGRYDHVVGLMAAIARLNLLLIIGVEDEVMAETVITGSLDGEIYRRGRNSVNYLTPGSSIQKMNSRVPFEAFQHLNTLERQLRIVGGYPVTDDAQSPNSFVTGRGLQELTASVDLDVREHHTVIADALREVDAIRLEWDEKYYGDRQKTMNGLRSGAPFSETYTPNTHIKGDYTVRRVYGAMAGFDEATKVLTGLQLLQAEIIDDDTMREQIDGLENHSKIEERIRRKKDEVLLDQVLAEKAAQGDERVLELKILQMPDGPVKDLYERIFLQQTQEQPQEEPVLPEIGGPEDVTTMLGRLTAGPGGVSPTMGAQTVQRVA